jgi:hypothetical protein
MVEQFGKMMGSSPPLATFCFPSTFFYCTVPVLLHNYLLRSKYRNHSQFCLAWRSASPTAFKFRLACQLRCCSHLSSLKENYRIISPSTFNSATEILRSPFAGGRMDPFVSYPVGMNLEAVFLIDHGLSSSSA